MDGCPCWTPEAVGKQRLDSVRARGGSDDMNITPLPLAGAHLVGTTPHGDHRGHFARLFCAREMADAGLNTEVVQANHSLTMAAGAVRGMHFQRPPMAEVKMLRCVRGAVFDVIVDIRLGSPTYMKWHGEILSAENMRLIYVPEGFAHGFQALEPASEVMYLVSQFYSPELEGGLRHDDPAIGIEWPLPIADVSQKDAAQPLVADGFVGIDMEIS